ncbi:MAG: hypothetical protein ACLUGJ_13375 [Blautia wexlerae]
MSYQNEIGNSFPRQKDEFDEIKHREPTEGIIVLSCSCRVET